MDGSSDKPNIVELTADVVAAYVSHNSVEAGHLSGLISDVHEALSSAASRSAAGARPELIPAVSRKKSVTPDYLICLEDGKKFKQLKRHLRTQYNMTPEEYREKWGLAPDYPMVAPNYAAARSALAKQMGLGQRRNKQRK
ncbi:MAG: MucR family transcriptional regulator [Pseudomonadota bacterium]